MGFSSNLYTLNNGRDGSANIQARLDRGFVNAVWRLLFPEASISHLPSIQFDHKPLLITTSSLDSFLPRPFRFEAMWTLNSSSNDIVHKAWSSSVSGSPLFQLASCLKITKSALKLWNKKVLGNISYNISNTREDIAHL